MPYYQNSLYGQGVPSYAEQLSPLADVFKAFAPNPVRDLQIQGYVSKANLEKLKGQQISHELGALDSAGDAIQANDQNAYYANVARSGNAALLQHAPGLVSGEYASRAISDPNSVDQDTLATLVVGGGGNYKNTQPGFTADQGRQLQQNENTTAASRYGHELQAGVGHEGNQLRFNASIYGADQNLAGKKYATDNDIRKREFNPNAGGAGKPPAPGQMNAATAKALAQTFARIPVDLDPEAADDIKARATFYVNNGDAETRNNPVGAFIRAQREVLGDTPTTTRKSLPIIGEYGDPTTVALPPGQRPGLPNPVANIFAAPPGGAASAPMAPAVAPGRAAPNSRPVQVTSVEEARALPPGTVFITPDGRQKVR